MRVFCAGAMPAGMGSMQAVRPPGGPNPHPSRRAVRVGGWSWVRYPRRCFELGCSTRYLQGRGEPSHGHEEKCNETYRPERLQERIGRAECREVGGKDGSN